MALHLINKVRKVPRAYKIMLMVLRHPLSRGRRMNAVAWWLRLLFAQWLTPTHHTVIPYVDGAALSWPEPASSVMLCARYGLGEYADMAFCLHLLRAEDLFCDVGANAGVYTILAGRAVGCSVIAAEPVPCTFDLLIQNIYANGISERVQAMRAAIGRQVGHVRFTSTLWSLNHVVSSSEEDTIEVDVLPLDSVLSARAPVAIKIDVEGFEAEVMAGAAKTLSNPVLQAVVIEMVATQVQRYGSQLEDILSALMAAGFSGPFWYDPNGRKLVNAGDQGPTKYNQIFVRDVNFVATRLASARQYAIRGTHV